jgi:hypothetical protein
MTISDCSTLERSLPSRDKCETLNGGNAWRTLLLLAAHVIKSPAMPTCGELHELGDSKEAIEPDWSA